MVFIRSRLFTAAVLILFGLVLSVPAQAQTTPSWTVSQGFIQKNGVRFFPRGFYHVSYYSSQKTQRMSDVQKMAAAGYNFIATPLNTSDDQFMATAAALGVNVVMEFNDDPTTLVRHYAGNPALACIATFDDVDAYNGSVPRYTPLQVSQRSTALKAIAPNTLTYISGGYPTRIGNYINTADTIGFQVYPIPYESLSSVTTAYLNPVLSKTRAAGRPLIANLQTFGWNGTARYPTTTEVRNMTYQALAAGVQGILYYTYFDGYTNLNNQPALWTELTKLGSELKVLQPFLLKGTRRQHATGKPEVFATSFKRGLNVVVMVVNANATASQSVSLTFTDNLNGVKTNMFTGRTGVMNLSGKTLSGTLPPGNVQVYKLGLAS